MKDIISTNLRMLPDWRIEPVTLIFSLTEFRLDRRGGVGGGGASNLINNRFKFD